MAKSGKKTSSSKKSKGAGSLFRFLPKKYILLGALIVLTAGTVISFVPEEKVPDSMTGLYDFCLTARNTVLARTGLNISRYEDTAVIREEGSPEIKLYFAPSPNIVQGLCDFIDGAEGTLDVCIYDLDLPPVANAILNAHKRGVTVRVVTDTDNANLIEVDRLAKNGITVKQDRRAPIMHNKFVVRDAKFVWTGSFNFTVNGATKNDNNALIVESPETAAKYLNKFDEYWNGQFGLEASIKTTHGRVFAGKIPVENAFSPSDGISAIIIDRLRFAKKSVRVMAFSFTSEPIAKQLGMLARNGIKVECLFDYGQAQNKFSRDGYLLGCGVKMKLSPNSRGKMHHKVMIIDDETVITGSYNFSTNAESFNDENIIIIKNKALAEKYIKEFYRCWKGTKGY